MDADETENTLFLAASGRFTDIYDAGCSPVTTNPIAINFPPTCSPYNGGEVSGCPDMSYDPRIRLYNHEYSPQFSNHQQYYNDQFHS